MVSGFIVGGAVVGIAILYFTNAKVKGMIDGLIAKVAGLFHKKQ